MPSYGIKAVITAVDKFTGPVRRISSSMSLRLGKAIAGVGRFAGRATIALGKMGIAAAALGAAAAVGVFKFAQAHATAADELAKSARRAGLTAQAYAELRHAAVISGATQEEFAKAMEKGARSIGEVKAGTGALVTLLNKTNPAFLRRLQATEDQTEAMDLLIAAMASLDDPAKRAAFAAAAFGRSGQKLSLLTENGVDGVSKLRSEFVALHGTINEDALKSAENYIDAQERMKGAIQGVKFAIGSQLLPILQPVIDGITQWTSANRGLIAENVSNWIATVRTEVESVDWEAKWEGVKTVAGWVGGLIETVNDLVRALSGTFAQVMIDIAQWTENPKQALRELLRLWENVAEKLDIFGISGASSGIERVGPSFDQTRQVLTSAGTLIDVPQSFAGAFTGGFGTGGAAVGQNTETSVRVEFANAPPGTRVTSVETKGPGKTEVDMGRRSLAGAKAGL